MDLILGNLKTLKAWLLPETWQSETQKDGVIAALGLGVAAAFETFCNRRLGRAVAEVQQFPGDEAVFICPRYPLESKPSLQVRWEGSDDWQDASGFQWNWRSDTGLVQTTAPVGTARTLLRVTYTGGFWVDTSEDGSGTLPAGATALPPVIASAWEIQCRHLWTALKLFANTGETATEHRGIAAFDLLPLVQQMLAPFRRFTL